MGHAFVTPVRWNCAVEVFGTKVKPGQLIHADKHGFMAVPAEEEARLLEAAVFMDANECKTVIPAAAGAAGATHDQTLRTINDARGKFSNAAKAQFHKGGEW